MCKLCFVACGPPLAHGCAKHKDELPRASWNPYDFFKLSLFGTSVSSFLPSFLLILLGKQILRSSKNWVVMSAIIAIPLRIQNLPEEQKETYFTEWSNMSRYETKFPHRKLTDVCFYLLTKWRREHISVLAKDGIASSNYSKKIPLALVTNMSRKHTLQMFRNKILCS